MIPLETPRLFLLPLAIADADALWSIRSDPDAMAYWDWPRDRTRAETEAAVRSLLEAIDAGTTQIWAARRKSDRSFVGVFDLDDIEKRSAELGFMLVRRMWRQGYGFEAAEALVEHAWSMGLSELHARTHEGNLRSQRLLARLGFATSHRADMEIRPGVMKPCVYHHLAR
jgi:RimJ/RimL family protein N-acetyltransferase